MNELGEFQDRILTGVDCGNEFTWSAGEQAFFRERRLMIEPKGCMPCRQARKNTREDADQKKGNKK